MSKECNGIMYMKDKRISSLETQESLLNSQLEELIQENQVLKMQEGKVSRELMSVQNQYDIVELDTAVTHKAIAELDRRGDYLKSEYTKLSQSAQEQQSELRTLQSKVEIYRTQLAEKQALAKRYSKQTQLNDRMVKASGKVFTEKQKVRKQLERNQRELAIIKNNLTAKNRFIGVLEKKMGVKPKREGEITRMKSQEKMSIGDVIDDIAGMQMRKMKSFDRLVREKNSVLLKSKRA